MSIDIIFNPGNSEVARVDETGLKVAKGKSIVSEGVVIEDGCVNARGVTSSFFSTDTDETILSDQGLSTIDAMHFNVDGKVIVEIMPDGKVVLPDLKCDSVCSEAIVAKKVSSGVVIAGKLECSTFNGSSIAFVDEIEGKITLSSLADKIPESIGTKRGDLLVFTAPGVAAILPAPQSKGMILVSDPDSPVGMSWKEVTNANAN